MYKINVWKISLESTKTLGLKRLKDTPALYDAAISLSVHINTASVTVTLMKDGYSDCCIADKN